MFYNDGITALFFLVLSYENGKEVWGTLGGDVDYPFGFGFFLVFCLLHKIIERRILVFPLLIPSK
jgi:hypothetical protein